MRTIPQEPFTIILFKLNFVFIILTPFIKHNVKLTLILLFVNENFQLFNIQNKKPLLYIIEVYFYNYFIIVLFKESKFDFSSTTLDISQYLDALARKSSK